MILMNESPPIFHIQKSDEQHITIRKIRNFLCFTPGWNYGEGNIFDIYTINRAVELHKIILSLAFNETDAFPSTDGSVVVTVYHDNYCLEFTIKTDSNIYYRLELNDESIYQEENLTLSQAKDILKQFRRERWRPSDSSIFDTMTVAENVFAPQLLHTSVREFRLLRSNVLLHLA